MEKTKIRIAAWNVQGPKGSGSEGLMAEPDPVTEGKIVSLLENETPDFAFLQEVPSLKWMKKLDPELFSEQISSRTENYCRGIMFYRKNPPARLNAEEIIVPGSADFPAAAGYIFKSENGKELFRFLGIWNAPCKTSQGDYFKNFTSILEEFQSFCHQGKNLLIAGDTNLILHSDAYHDDVQKQDACRNMRKNLEKKLKELDLPPVYPVADNADTLKHIANGCWYQCDLLMVSKSLLDGLKTGLGRRDIYIDELKSDHLPILAEFYVPAS